MTTVCTVTRIDDERRRRLFRMCWPPKAMSDDEFDRLTALADCVEFEPPPPDSSPTTLDVHQFLVKATCRIQNDLSKTFGVAGEESQAMAGLYGILGFLETHAPDLQEGDGELGS